MCLPPLQLGILCFFPVTKSFGYDVQQVVIDKILNFQGLGVHDPVKAEIKVRLIKRDVCAVKQGSLLF